jgi:hypothetical protein
MCGRECYNTLMLIGKKHIRTHADGELHLEHAAADIVSAEKPLRFEWLHRFLHDKKGLKYYFIALAVIIVTGVGVLVLLAQYKSPKLTVAAPVVHPKPVPAIYYSPLTGDVVPDKATTTRAVTAVMIENSPDARPQSGIKNSGIVYEAVAEGGITRFLVLYQEQQPTLVGPVRSVRPYYVDWLAPFDASIAHVGGSAKALGEVRNGQYRDIDEFFNSGAYYRSTDRVAPHNVYTTFARLNALNAAKGYTSSTFTGFPRVPIVQKKTTVKPKTNAKPVPALTPATTINVNISAYNLYNSTYTYDKTNNDYLRNQDGAPHLDREDGQITPRVVIVIKVPTQTVMEDGYREEMQTVGTGQGDVFQDGTVEPITWQKTSTPSQIHFLDSNNKDVPLERGQTWIAAIATDKTVSWQ